MFCFITYFKSRNPVTCYLAAALFVPELVAWTALYSFLALFLGLAPALVVIVLLLLGAGYVAFKVA